MTGEVDRYLVVGATLFVLGALGFFTRRNLILMVLSAELMLHGVSLTFVTFGRLHNSFQGQSFTIFILTVAACEAGLALSLILALYQRSKTLDIDFWSELREPDLPSPRIADEREARDVVAPPPLEFPHLTPAGHVPDLPDEFSQLMDDARGPGGAELPPEPAPAKELVKSAAR